MTPKPSGKNHCGGDLCASEDASSHHDESGCGCACELRCGPWNDWLERQSGKINPVILFRSGSLENEAEIKVALRYFPVCRYRTEVPENSLVIGRFSVLPFYHELCQDLENRNAALINPEAAHSWIAGFHWYDDLKEFTPRSWDERDFHKSGYDGPLFLKGRTNSRKAQFDKACYAKDRQAAYDVASILANDPLIGPQGIIYREFVPLKVFERCSIYGTPFANEWRLFWYRDTLLSKSYYWTNASEWAQACAVLAPDGLDLAHRAAEITKDHAAFYVMDIAETEDGRWILIEMNEGQMSGIPIERADELYSNLAKALAR